LLDTRSLETREEKKDTAGEVLTAEQAPHRPGTAPALGLRAGRGRRFHYSAGRFPATEDIMPFREMLQRLFPPPGRARQTLRPRPRCRPWLEVLEDRLAPAVHQWTGAVNTLGISPRKANQVWAYARAWLREELGDDE
jgi:hypothetical protein